MPQGHFVPRVLRPTAASVDGQLRIRHGRLFLSDVQLRGADLIDATIVSVDDSTWDLSRVLRDVQFFAPSVFLRTADAISAGLFPVSSVPYTGHRSFLVSCSFTKQVLESTSPVIRVSRVW